MMQTISECFISLILSHKFRKRQLCSVVPPTKSAQAISSIFIPKRELGQNWQQSTTKIAVTLLRCDVDS